MKKIYEKPTTKMVMIIAERLLNNASTAELEVVEDETVEDVNDLLSRERYNLWEETEEEEESMGRGGW
jgi:hypothetical protein